MKHNWKYRPFAKILRTITPTSKIEKSAYRACGQYPIISQEDVFISGFWDNVDDITQHSTPVVIFGDHSRVLKYIDFEFVVGADGVKIIQPNDSLNAKFLYHFLKWYNVPSLGYSRHFKLLKEAIYPVPPMATQEQIVAELDQINALITKNRELLSQLEALTQSLFYDTFGDPISNHKGWDVYDIKSISEVLRDGPFGSNLKSSHYTDCGIRVIRLQNIGVGYFDNKDKAFISEDYYPNISKYTCYPGDVILGTLGNPNLRACIVPPYLEKAIHKADCVRLVPERTLLESKYVAAYFNNPSVLCMASKDVHGATRARISCGQIAKFSIPVPPLSLQEDFAAKVEAIEGQKAKVEAEIIELQTLLDARMDYWFN